MTVVGIDPGSHRCGWSVWSDGSGGMRLLESGVIRPGRGDAAARIAALRQVLRQVLARAALLEPPLTVAVEHARELRGSRVAAVAVLSEIVGAVGALCDEVGAELVRVHPSTWQAEVLRCGPTAVRAARKRGSTTMAQALVGRELDEDEADAVLIGWWAARRANDGGGAEWRRRKGRQHSRSRHA